MWAASITDTELLEYMKTAAGVKKVIEERESHVYSNQVKSNPLSYWIAAAAIVLLSVFGGLLLKIDRDAYRIGIQQIELIELESGSITRSGNNGISSEDSLLNLGIKAIVDGKKAKAKTLLQELINRSPESETAGLAYINLGILHYNESKFDVALTQFERATSLINDDEFAKEKALWFMAHTYINLKRLDEARKTAIDIYMSNLALRKRAFVLIKELDQQLKFQTFEDDFELEAKE
jgi:tetratricopeptide (TPR) repeat protein